MSDKEKNRKFKFKNKSLKGKEGDGKEVEIQIRTKGGNEVEANFKDSKKDTESEAAVEFEYRKKENDKWPEKWTGFTSKVKWDGGFVANGMKLTDKTIGGVEIKEEISVPMGFFGTLTIWSWIGLVLIIIAIGALIWWWIASSNKEDKEEEVL
jgi:hypothetical protein